MAQMPLVRTPIGMLDFARAFVRMLRAMGQTPTKAAGGVLWAQYALETDAGAACWNFNLWNHKVAPAQVSAGVPWFDLPGTWEVIDGVRTTLKEGDPGRRFRAYASFESAMSDHVNAIRNGRYASSWAPLLAGDVEGYARELRAKGYYTAPLASYVAALHARVVPWEASTVFESAIEEIEEASEAVTDPEIPIIHMSPYSEDDPEPPDEAA